MDAEELKWVHERQFFWISKPGCEQLRLDISHCRARDEGLDAYIIRYLNFSDTRHYTYLYSRPIDVIFVGIPEPARHCISCESLDHEAGIKTPFHSSCWPDSVGDFGGDIGADLPEYHAHTIRAAVGDWIPHAVGRILRDVRWRRYRQPWLSGLASANLSPSRPRYDIGPQG